LLARGELRHDGLYVLAMHYPVFKEPTIRVPVAPGPHQRFRPLL